MRQVLVVALMLGLVAAGMPAADLFAQDMGGAKIPPMAAPKPAKPGSVVLSVVMPGTGEWLNRDFEGPFPVIECFTGYVCFLIMFSSALDAAAGDVSEKIRLDFWSKPMPGR